MTRKRGDQGEGRWGKQAGKAHAHQAVGFPNHDMLPDRLWATRLATLRCGFAVQPRYT